MSPEQALLEVENLKKWFPVTEGLLTGDSKYEKAVDDVDLRIEPGEILGLVGESGCGKTTLARCVLRLIDPTSGKIWLKGQRTDHLSQRQFRPYRRDIQVVFQDPMDSLDPRFPVGKSIEEGLKYLTGLKPSERQQVVREKMDQVGLDSSEYDSYPHQLSGGQRQRVGIARALAVDPDLVICDEPTSALDVSIQAQIINLLLDLRDELGLGYLFISHNLELVRYIGDRIAVMDQGIIVESGTSNEVYQDPKHEYTQRLLKASIH